MLLRQAANGACGHPSQRHRLKQPSSRSTIRDHSSRESPHWLSTACLQMTENRASLTFGLPVACMNLQLVLAASFRDVMSEPKLLECRRPVAARPELVQLVPFVEAESMGPSGQSCKRSFEGLQNQTRLQHPHVNPGPGHAPRLRLRQVTHGIAIICARSCMGSSVWHSDTTRAPNDWVLSPCRVAKGPPSQCSS